MSTTVTAIDSAVDPEVEAERVRQQVETARADELDALVVLVEAAIVTAATDIETALSDEVGVALARLMADRPVAHARLRKALIQANGAITAPLVERVTTKAQRAASADAGSDGADWSVCDEPGTRASVEGFEVRQHKAGRLGLWRLPAGDDADEQYIGSPVWLRGIARDPDGMDFCTVVDFVDLDGRERRWLMPREQLAADGSELLRSFYRRGAEITRGRGARDALHAYLFKAPRDRFTTVTSTGWHENTFVLPTRTVGPGHHLLANPPTRAPGSGTLAQWRNSIGASCIGNTRLMFAVSAGFVSVLLKIADAESGGAHLIGDSSGGKTSALCANASVWVAKPTSWRATDNGLEGKAARLSDCGFALDEIGESDARAAGAIVYMLANGAGKLRAERDGTDRPVNRWRLFFMSSGEKTLGQHMAEAGGKAKAGQDLRLLAIGADAGAGMGLFESTRGMDVARFAEKIVADASSYHGTAGPAFVDHIVGREPEVRDTIGSIRAVFDARADVVDADGQVRRAARRFALIAAAGEIATKAGITGWAPGDATEAATACFESWRSSWTPSGSHEGAASITQVRAFLQTQEARFQRDPDDRLSIPNKAGYVGRGTPGEYLIFPAVFREEVCKGHRPDRVADALVSAGYLATDIEGGRTVRQVRRRVDG